MSHPVIHSGTDVTSCKRLGVEVRPGDAWATVDEAAFLADPTDSNCDKSRTKAVSCGEAFEVSLLRAMAKDAI